MRFKVIIMAQELLMTKIKKIQICRILCKNNIFLSTYLKRIVLFDTYFNNVVLCRVCPIHIGEKKSETGLVKYAIIIATASKYL